MGRFDDKVVWITGASSGIGRYLALEFAGEGADLVLTARRAERLEALASEVDALGRTALVAPGDVSDEDGLEGIVARAVDEFGGLDVCVANAGFGVSGKIESLAIDDWRRQFEVNVFGAVATVRAALPRLRERSGRIGLVASVSAMLPTPSMGPYTASKYALRAIGQTLSIELHGSGVSCTTMHPGFVASEIAQVDNTGVHHEDRRDPRPQKLMWDTDKAARVMVRAMHKRKREYVFTGHGKIAGWLGRHMPGLVHFAMTRNSAKAAGEQAEKG